MEKQTRPYIELTLIQIFVRISNNFESATVPQLGWLNPI